VPCPDDCAYLLGTHAGAWEGRTTERERDHRRIAPFLGPLSEAQQQLFVASLAGLSGIAAARRDVDDRVVAQAIAALRQTAETRAKGVLYEHQAEDVRAQALLLDLKPLYERRDESGNVSRPADADLVAVLRALEESISATLAERAAPAAFLETATRVAGELVEMADDEAGQERVVPSPRIILPD
jgi:hypothetical protein